MGIDIGDAHWAYSGFMRFRERIAAVDGIPLERMVGFCRHYGQHDATECPTATTPWDTVTSDLKPLLNHSDCDGELTPEECAQVAPRLAQVLPEAFPDADYDRKNGEALVEAMAFCAMTNKPLEFR